jgi:molybdenum cofactor guanylyltransferase
MIRQATPAAVQESAMTASEYASPARSDITGLILAGGRGSRMGGIDKGLAIFRGRPMVEHVIVRLRSQVGMLVINANRSVERYAAFGFPVVPDRRDGFLGPLAGMAAGLEAAQTPYVVTVPCDSPLIDENLVARLARALARERADMATAHDGERAHPVFLLLRRDLLSDLDSFLDAGGRKVEQWLAQHRVAYADFSDTPDSFRNVNNIDDRDELEAKFAEIEF